MARTHKANAIAKWEIRADFRSKYVNEEIQSYETRYLELQGLIDNEKRHSPKHTELTREQNYTATAIGTAWINSYIARNPDATIEDYSALEESWTMTVEEGKSIGKHYTGNVIL